MNNIPTSHRLPEAVHVERKSVAEQRQKVTREHILKAAYGCLIEIGYEKITTRRIAEAADVNIATLHYYFGTKEALLSAAMVCALEETERILRASFESAPTAADALAAGLQKMWQMVREQRPGILRYDVVVRGLRDPEARREANSIYSVYRRLMEEILRRHLAEGGKLTGSLTVEQAAYYIISLIDGVVLQHTISQDEEAGKLGLSLILAHALQLMGNGDGRIADEPTRF